MCLSKQGLNENNVSEGANNDVVDSIATAAKQCGKQMLKKLSRIATDRKNASTNLIDVDAGESKVFGTASSVYCKKTASCTKFSNSV